ncbi:ABC transporter ATP-binding protein [Roseivirga misakiensis]|uniref:ABC transporter ATP-binding protein n=1 Tax=Roseivirga misakiensis TaxID=1563681 RepID=A0A1E5SKM3_9BACT|nr:ATP-binding cassette domain-containing protein [Roseivirga misakiensis]OEJ99684.1 ABC transporter ATP-binding protein [Roseivirga misakiensis]
MRIEVKDLGKKFNKEWIFRHLNTEFLQNQSYAVTGGNGSGKSTFIQTLIGYIPANEGEITFESNGTTIPEEKVFQHLDIITPYLELIEEFTLDEFLAFHFKFKTLSNGYSIDDFVNKVYLEADRGKQIKNYSSGMKQRLKLGLGFFSKSEVCLLDEPTTNLDEQGIAWYLENVKPLLGKKLLIISSNQKKEYDFCDNVLHIADYK